MQEQVKFYKLLLLVDIFYVTVGIDQLHIDHIF